MINEKYTIHIRYFQRYTIFSGYSKIYVYTSTIVIYTYDHINLHIDIFFSTCSHLIVQTLNFYIIFSKYCIK